jgi:class 3 adenylate cyclase/tetratricopeptide (TPR) repeat protein
MVTKVLRQPPRRGRNRAAAARTASYERNDTTPGSPPDVSMYLPDTLVRQLGERSGRPSVWAEELDGTIAHCDISGFTPMSEALSSIGKEGAEVIAGILNRFFDRMLGIATSWGGDCLKFGGDAMLLYFGGSEHAAHAVAAGIEMQEAMREFRQVRAADQEHPLRMRIGAHSGSFVAASVGTGERLLHYFVTGTTLNRAAVAEAEGEAGRVVVTRETGMALGDRARLVKAKRARLLRVVSIEAPERPGRSTLPPVPDAMLSRYVHPAVVAARTAAQRSTFVAEHRRASIVFINLLGLSDLLARGGKDRVLPELDHYMTDALGLLDKHRGFLIGTDASEDGDKIIAAFGAPVAIEGAEASAVRFAVELDRAHRVSGSALQHRLGINSGFVFAGEVGGANRREYTTIGDDVNLSARLMANARSGEILVSHSTLEKVPGVEQGRARLLRVKGKSRPVRAARLKGISATSTDLADTSADLVGRELELALILGEARAAARGRSRWLYVRGEPGIGKSALSGAAAARLNDDGWKVVTAYCQSHMSSTPFAPWLFALQGVIGVEPEDEPGAAASKVQAYATQVSVEHSRFAPLVCELMGLPVEESPFLKALSVQLRRQGRASLVIDMVNAASTGNPLLLLFEDMHWADGSSLEMLSDVITRAEGKLLVIGTSRLVLPEELAKRRPTELILEPLSDTEARHLSESYGLADESLDLITSRAAGNPLFILELARSSEPGATSLPDTVNDVIMARIDSLPPDQRGALRLASVIGPSFGLDDLRALAARLPLRKTVDHAVDDLTKSEFLKPVPGGRPTLAFMHALTQAAAYETLPFAERRNLHASFADHLEESHETRLESVSELLLHHCERADDWRRSALYAAMAGDRAAAIYANREALEYYDRSIAAVEKVGGTSADRSLLFERIGDCLESSGSHKDASEAFIGALDEFRGTPLSKPSVVPWLADPRVREAELSRKAGISCERASDYDGALVWLDQAEQALPPRPGRLRGQIFAGKSVSLFRKGEYAEGVRWGKRAVEWARRAKDDEGIAYAHSMLANSYVEQGLLKEAIAHLKPAIAIYDALEDVRGLAVANNNLGSCYQLLGDMASALANYRVAYDASERMGDTRGSTITSNNIGEALYAVGRYDEAVAQLEDVTRTHVSGGDVAAVAGLAHVNLSRCYLATGDLANSEWHVLRGMRLLRELGAEGLLTEARVQLGELRLAQGNPGRARAHASRAQAQARLLEARVLEARSARLLGLAYGRLGRRARALAGVLESLELARQISADHEEARSAIALGRLVLDLDAACGADAKKALRRAVSVLTRMGAVPELREAETILAELGDDA